MGVTKSEIFTDRQNQLAAWTKVLGHPARIAILDHLFNIKTCVCGDLVTEIGLSQPTISQHLKELKSTGLIKGSISGNRVCYCIDEKAWAAMRTFLKDFLNRDITNTNCCN